MFRSLISNSRRLFNDPICICFSLPRRRIFLSFSFPGQIQGKSAMNLFMQIDSFLKVFSLLLLFFSCHIFSFFFFSWRRKKSSLFKSNKSLWWKFLFLRAVERRKMQKYKFFMRLFKFYTSFFSPSKCFHAFQLQKQEREKKGFS